MRTLLHFEEIHPDYGRLFQERGHCYRTVSEAAAAIEAFQRAVSLNPVLPASWTALTELYRSVGMNAQAEHAAQRAAQLAQLPPPVLSARNMFAEGDTYGAERAVRHFLQTHGDHIEASRRYSKVEMAEIPSGS